MLISLVGDMIDVSDEELKAIAWDLQIDKPTRADVILYLKHAFMVALKGDMADYREQLRITQIAALKAEAAAKLEEAKRLEDSDG